MKDIIYCKATIAPGSTSGEGDVFVPLTNSQIWAGDDEEVVDCFVDNGGEVKLLRVRLGDLCDLRPEE